MKKMLKVLLWIVGILVLAFLVLVLCFWISGLKESSVKDKNLVKYTYSRSGGMSGGGYSETIQPYDETRAIVSVKQRDWWYEDREVDEYLVDIKVLEDIREVFNKYHMKKWEGKKFTKYFIADGESEGYSFGFENHVYVSFSSQMYSKYYADKLSEIDEVISKYAENKEQLPGLVRPEIKHEEVMDYQSELASNGKINLEVYEYSLGKINYRITNGTDNTVSVKYMTVSVFKENEEIPIYQNKSDYENLVARGGTAEGYTEEILRLQPGVYILKAGEGDELSCTFEIK